MSQPFEGDAIAKVNIGEDEYVMHRYNSALFTHLSHLMMYDHIYLDGGEDQTGAYIFRSNDGYNNLRLWMKRNKFVSHLNLTEVAECDQSAFEESIRLQTRDLQVAMPEDFH